MLPILRLSGFLVPDCVIQTDREEKIVMVSPSTRSCILQPTQHNSGMTIMDVTDHSLLGFEEGVYSSGTINLVKRPQVETL